MNDHNITYRKIIFNYLKQFSIIPLKENSKQPACNWKEYQVRKLTLEEAEKMEWYNIAIVTGSVSGLVVIDADTKETIEFLEEFEEFKKTVKVETKRGRHYYFLVYDIPDDYSTQKIYRENIRIDVKANGGYVVAPPSIIDGHVYKWIGSDNGGGIHKAVELNFSELMYLLDKIKKKLFPEADKPHTGQGKSSVNIDYKKLKKLILKKYEEGKRQDIILYLSGWLKKLGEPKEKVDELVVDICLAANDRDVIQRLSAVTNTFNKDDDLKGISGLISCGFSSDELNKVIKENKDHNGSPYIELDGIVYVSKNNNLKMLGPAVTISAVVDDGNHKAYEVSYRNGSEIIKDITDLTTIQKFTGIAVVREKDFLEFLNLQAIKCNTYKYIRRATGWKNGIFYHPAIQTEDIWDYWGFFNRVGSFEYEKDKQHELIKESMKTGGKLSFVYAFCLASVMNELLKTNPSVMFITGAAKVGKTTLAQLGINLFLPSEQIFTTAYSTHTGFELTMKQLRGLPILFDECILKDMELERIVFMVASRVGKIRGTKNLSINISEINSNVIFTSEILEQSQFKRAGSHRRLVAITLENFKKECYSKLTAEEMQRWRQYYGAGVDVIKFIMMSGEKWRRLEEIVERDIEVNELQSLYHVTKPVLTAIKVFEDFYGENFSRAYNDAIETIIEQKQEFDSRVDLLTKFREDFTQFLVRKSSQIIDIYDTSKRPSHDVIGQREGENFYILTSAFREFCNEFGYEQKVLTKELLRNNIIINNAPSQIRKMKRINGIAVSVYHIVLDQNRERAEIP